MLAASALKRKALATNKAAWYRLSLDEFVPRSETTDSLRFGFMDFDEASDFFRTNHEFFPWMFFDEEMQVARTARHMFPCLKDEDRVVGYIKLGIEKVFLLDFGRILNIPPDAAFIYDTFVAPPYRGRGTGATLIGMTAGFAREEGFRSLWCHIPPWNEPSKKAFGRCGFRPVGEVRFVRLLGRELLWKQPGNFPLSHDDEKKSDELKLVETSGRQSWG